MIILSIDSGIERTGYALFDKNNKYKEGFQYLTSGLIRTQKDLRIEKRIYIIYQKIKKLIKRYIPDKIIIEQIFFLKNQKTAIKVSQTQGVIMLLAAEHNLTIDFITPLQIKQVITGYGQSDKKSVQKMLNLILKLPLKIEQDDQADAIAAGLTYCYINTSLIS